MKHTNISFNFDIAHPEEERGYRSSGGFFILFYLFIIQQVLEVTLITH